MNNRDTIRLDDIFISMMKHRMLIVLLTVAGLAIGVIATFVQYLMGEISKEYTITASIAVTSENQDGLFTTRTESPNSADIHLSEDMVDSTIYLLRSDKIMNQVIERMNLVGIPTTNVTSHLDFSRYRETQIIEITFYWRSAEEGVRILDALIDIAPDILVKTLKIGSVSVLNEPSAKYRVGGSIQISNWILGSLAGFFAGAGFCTIQVMFLPTLVKVQDVKLCFKKELLGQIPDDPKFYRQRKQLQHSDNSRSGVAIREGYAAAAYMLHNKLQGGNCFLYVTSAGEEEGKTSTVANIAIQLAKQEHRVLMIDFDVHQPSLGTLFLDHVEYEYTINAMFHGDAAAEQVIIPINGYLDLVPAILENRELPIDDSTLSMIRELGEGYDYVLIDTAAVGCSVDTLGLNRIAQGAIFVVRYDTLSMSKIQDAMSRMDNSGITTVGCIVNAVKHYSLPIPVSRNLPEKAGRSKQGETETVPANQTDASANKQAENV